MEIGEIFLRVRLGWFWTGMCMLSRLNNTVGLLIHGGFCGINNCRSVGFGGASTGVLGLGM